MTTFFRSDFSKSRQVYDKNNNKKNIIVSDFNNQLKLIRWSQSKTVFRFEFRIKSCLLNLFNFKNK